MGQLLEATKIEQDAASLNAGLADKHRVQTRTRNSEDAHKLSLSP
jgi:hypothetical protein